MKRLFAICLVSLLSMGSAVAYADQDSLTAVCQQIIQEHAGTHPIPKASLKLLLTYLFQRNTFVRPQEVRPEPNPSPASPPDLDLSTPRQNPDADLGTAKVSIFTLGHPAPVTDVEQSLLKQLGDQLKTQAKFIQKLNRSESVSLCVSQAQSLGWSSHQIDSVSDLEKASIPAQRHQESQLSYNAAKIAIKRHSNWKIVSVDSWGEILESLRVTPAQGMMVIAHADSNGRLYDSQRDELPSRFFDSISATVQFIGVYSCYSDAVERAYSLKKLARTHHVDTVDLAFPFDKSESAPIQFFPTWVGKVLKQDRSRALPQVASGNDICELSIQKLNLQQGRVSLTLNGFPVGVWSGSDADLPRPIQCSWALSGSTPLSAFVQPSASGAPTAFSDYDFKVFIRSGKNTLRTLNSKQTFFDSSGSFRSVLISP